MPLFPANQIVFYGPRVSNDISSSVISRLIFLVKYVSGKSDTFCNHAGVWHKAQKCPLYREKGNLFGLSMLKLHDVSSFHTKSPLAQSHMTGGANLEIPSHSSTARAFCSTDKIAPYMEGKRISLA